MTGALRLSDGDVGDYLEVLEFAGRFSDVDRLSSPFDEQVVEELSDRAGDLLRTSEPEVKFTVGALVRGGFWAVVTCPSGIFGGNGSTPSWAKTRALAAALRSPEVQ